MRAQRQRRGSLSACLLPTARGALPSPLPRRAAASDLRRLRRFRPAGRLSLCAAAAAGLQAGAGFGLSCTLLVFCWRHEKLEAFLTDYDSLDICPATLRSMRAAALGAIKRCLGCGGGVDPGALIGALAAAALVSSMPAAADSGCDAARPLWARQRLGYPAAQPPPAAARPSRTRNWRPPAARRVRAAPLQTVPLALLPFAVCCGIYKAATQDTGALLASLVRRPPALPNGPLATDAPFPLRGLCCAGAAQPGSPTPRESARAPTSPPPAGGGAPQERRFKLGLEVASFQSLISDGLIANAREEDGGGVEGVLRVGMDCLLHAFPRAVAVVLSTLPSGDRAPLLHQARQSAGR